MIKRFRYIYVCLIAVLACCVSTSVSAQSVFAHYKGVNDMPYIRNPYGIEMQQVHEYEYTYYVTGGSEIDLPLPFENYTKEKDTDIEPKATSDGTTIIQTWLIHDSLYITLQT